MSVLTKLASALNRRDEVPNQELAIEIVKTQDTRAIKELVENLSNKKPIQNDCIKVLYEIGEKDPKLITDYLGEFLKYLSSKNNRLQWGAMTALSSITSERPAEIYESLNTILSAADKGSVITKDHAVNILIKLCTNQNYADNAFSLLIEQLLKSPVNQLPMYAERAIPVINDKNKTSFLKALRSRLDEVGKESKKKRVQKVIKKFSEQN